MSANLEAKKQVVEEIKEKIQNSKSVVFVDYKGLTVAEVSELRNKFRAAGVEYKVYKNTLLRKAMEQCETDYSELYDLLKGETTLLLSNTGNAPARLIKDFRQKNETLPALKGAYVEETVYAGEDQLETLAHIKSKNELIADIVALLQSPAKHVISALQSGGNKLHGILESLSKKEEA